MKGCLVLFAALCGVLPLPGSASLVTVVLGREPAPTLRAGEEPGPQSDSAEFERERLSAARRAWQKASKLSEEGEIFVAFTWMLMLAGAPLMLRAWDGRKTTNVQLATWCALWLAVLGGLYLFTNVIVFNSGLFAEPRTLNVVECVYLMSQIITTVGYGDITPANPRGQVFIGLYVLLALFVVANVMSELMAHITAEAEKYKQSLVQKVHAATLRDARGEGFGKYLALPFGATRAEEDAAEEAERRRSAARMRAASICFKSSSPPSLAGLGWALVAFLCFSATWALFFHLFPGEEKPLLTAIYMSVITMSSVGFGAVTPQTQGGMVFASFFMIFGSAALLAVVTTFTTYMVELGEYERFDPNLAAQSLEQFKRTHSKNEMTEAEFLLFGLENTGLVSERDLDAVRRSFRALADVVCDDGMAYVSFRALGQALV